MTISSIFFKNKKLYFINFKLKKLELIKKSSLTHIDKYNLIISDEYFFYLSLEIPTKSKNIRNIIWNYLKAHFPEALISNFGFVLHNNHVIVFIFNEELKNSIKENLNIFKKAKYVSTPFLELLKKKDKFLYKTKQIIYNFNRGAIELSFSSTSIPISEEDVIFTLDKLENNIELPILRKKVFTKKELISLASVFILSYSMFLGGNILKLNATNIVYKKYSDILTNLYQQNGIINSSDPYGELLYKVSKISNKSNKIKISKILYDFSISCPNDCIINSISYQQNTIICYGYTTQLSKLDKLRINLKRYFSSVEIVNTSKQNEKVNFSLKCKI